MGPFQISVFEGAVTTVLAAAMIGMWAMLRAFVKEQREANEANRMANRSMQREVIYRMFREHVERGEPMAPHELDHLEDVYGAYHANGGNGTATVMYDRIREFGRISTEVKEV